MSKKMPEQPETRGSAATPLLGGIRARLYLEVQFRDGIVGLEKYTTIPCLLPRKTVVFLETGDGHLEPSTVVELSWFEGREYVNVDLSRVECDCERSSADGIAWFNSLGWSK